MQRYLLQPARVEEALELGQLKVGSKEGLKALVDALFAVGKVRHMRCWLDLHLLFSGVGGGAHTVLMHAWLAGHRQQLASIWEMLGLI
jgi:hypothetical protein